MKESNESKLIGKTVELYMIGGHIISGKIQMAGKDRLVLEDDGKFYLAYRDKICGIWMNAEFQNISKPLVEITPRRYDPPRPTGPLEVPSSYPENGIGQGNVYGPSLPSDILIPDETESLDDDFSAFFGSDKARNNLLNVVLMEEAEEQYESNFSPDDQD